MNSAPSQISFGIPTPEVVESWKAECVRLKDQIESLQAQFAAYESMIQGAQALLPLFSESSAVAEAVADFKARSAVPKRRGRPPKSTQQVLPNTWTGIVEKTVQDAGRLSYETLRAEIAKTPFGARLEENDKSFYGAVGKLSDASRLVRHNGWLFSPSRFKAFERDLKAGKVKDEAAPRNPSQSSPFGDAIKAFLEKMPSGANSAEIIAELRKTPALYDTIERHSSHTYNVLSRLVEQGELTKGGGKFFRAPGKATRGAGQ